MAESLNPLNPVCEAGSDGFSKHDASQTKKTAFQALAKASRNTYTTDQEREMVDKMLCLAYLRIRTLVKPCEANAVAGPGASRQGLKHNPRLRYFL